MSVNTQYKRGPANPFKKGSTLNLTAHVHEPTSLRAVIEIQIN